MSRPYKSHFSEIPKMHNTKHEISAAQPTTQLFLRGTGKFAPHQWPALAAPIYRAMSKDERWAALQYFRTGARSRSLGAADHLLYALLRGKNPFKTFATLKAVTRLAAGELPWRGVIDAAAGASYRLRDLESAAVLPVALTVQLRQLALLAQIRGTGMSVHALDVKLTNHRRSAVERALRATPQGGGSVAQHCKKTYDAFRGVMGHLKTGLASTLPVPDWLGAHRDAFLKLGTEELVPMYQYLTMHDCSKPFCLEFDEEGRAHFPGHAALSARLWVELGGSVRVASLIAQDMDLHMLKAEDAEAFATRPDAGLLLLSGLASLHANAADFGGAGSDSFKIKFKRLSSRGARISKIMFEKSEGINTTR